MGGFEFGTIAALDAKYCMLSLFLVVGFILLNESILDFLEFRLEDDSIYNKMVQCIYRELMQMGLITFIIGIYQSSLSPSHMESEMEYSLMGSIQFTDIFLFFIAIFFVVHAFFLMSVALSTCRKFYKMFHVDFEDLILDAYSENVFQRFLLRLTYLPFSFLREEIEFKILQ